MIYETATVKGLDVSFVVTAGTSSTRLNSSSAGWSGGSAGQWDCAKGDGSKEQVYNCIKGHLEQLELTEEETGLILMMSYGLMKAPDLEILPTTWRAQLIAALRVSVIHGIKSEKTSKKAAAHLQSIVSLWRPTWKQDYDTFLGRGDVGELLVKALAQAQKLTATSNYKDSERVFDSAEAVTPMQEAFDPEEIASI